jgi:hypothetical protein
MRTIGEGCARYILSAAAQSGCRLLLSEDLREGFTWAGVTVVDPFSSPKHALKRHWGQGSFRQAEAALMFVAILE